MEELMTIQDVATYLKMSSQTIYRMAQENKIPALKVRNRWRFRRSDIESWLISKDDRSAKSILVVDDDPDVAELFVRVLRPEGHRIATALTGRAAIRQVQQRSFGLIYLDLALPDLSGPETLRAIREIDGSPSVVVITGNAEGSLLQQILELGPFTVLVKPFGPEKIIETVQMLA
jgi:excisionase family DNA binding protein